MAAGSDSGEPGGHRTDGPVMESGKTWKVLVDTYHAEITALGGWVADTSGVFFANPMDDDPALRLRVESEDFVVQTGK